MRTRWGQEGVGCVVQCAWLGWMNLTGRIMGREHTGKDLRETPLEAAGVQVEARMWVIRESACYSPRPGKMTSADCITQASCPLARNWLLSTGSLRVEGGRGQAISSSTPFLLRYCTSGTGSVLLQL